MNANTDLKDIVRRKYGEAARRARSGGSSCCGAAPAASSCCDPITSNLYDAGQAGEVPGEALEASLGCGNPTALAELKPGETVLDLGSGGGIDVLLSARRVGPAAGRPATGRCHWLRRQWQQCRARLSATWPWAWPIRRAGKTTWPSNPMPSPPNATRRWRACGS